MVQAIHFVPSAVVSSYHQSGQRLQDAPEAVVISDATVIAYIRAVVPEGDGLLPKPPGFTSMRQCPRWRRSRTPPFNKRPSTNVPSSSYNRIC